MIKEFVCECGKECKSQRGLSIHRVRCYKRKPVQTPVAPARKAAEIVTPRAAEDHINYCPKCGHNLAAYRHTTRLVGHLGGGTNGQS